MMLSAALCGVPFLGAVIVSPYSSIQDLLLAVLSRTETHLYMKFFQKQQTLAVLAEELVDDV